MDFLNILFIVTTEEFLDEQIDLMLNIAGVFCFETTTAKVYELEHINQIFDNCDKQYNYIYIAGHGNEDGTIIGDYKNNYKWEDIIKIINESGCVSENALLYIQGCYSSNASKYILDNCKNINQIIGFETELKNIESYTSFLNFLYYVTHKGYDNEKSINIVKNTIYKNIAYIKQDKIKQ